MGIRALDPAAVVTTYSRATERSFLRRYTFKGIIWAALGPLDCPELQTTHVPVLHPTHQDLWRSRLGDSAEVYRAALAETLADVIAQSENGPSEGGVRPTQAEGRSRRNNISVFCLFTNKIVLEFITNSPTYYLIENGITHQNS